MLPDGTIFIGSHEWDYQNSNLVSQKSANEKQDKSVGGQQVKPKAKQETIIGLWVLKSGQIQFGSKVGSAWSGVWEITFANGKKDIRNYIEGKQSGISQQYENGELKVGAIK